MTHVAGVATSWDHHDEDPSTWSEDYKRWTQDKPHAAAVSQAQEKARMHYPTMVTQMGSEDDATASMHHLLRQGGHPLADQGSATQHNDPKRGFSQAYRSEGMFPSVDIHESRWDYGTLAHEVAHHLHQHHDLGGRRPADDAEAHGPDFVKHYQNVLQGMLGRRKGPEASQLLGDSYHEALGRYDHPPGARREAASRQEPHQRILGPTYGLDVRLFDGEHLKPAVRQWVLKTIERFWHPLYGRSWRRWAKPAFCGSEASGWTSPSRIGNGDFDVLVGIDGDTARQQVAAFAGLDDDAIVARLNNDLTTLLWPRLSGVMLDNGTKSEIGPFDVTVYCNASAWHIADIKPYAAYDLLSDTWAVKPPVLTHWSIESFPQGHALVQYCHAIAATVRSVLKMPEPYRHQSADALWRFLHSDRGRAFTPQGEGWYDQSNVVEKYCDQLGLWEPLAALHFEAAEHPHLLDAPTGWSNTPG